jgi:hypothetical protein
MYAVANVFEFCFEKDAQRSFEICCESLAHSRWPHVLWEGTYFGDVHRMIAACRREYKLRDYLKIHIPFWKNTPKDNGSYWRKFDALIEQSKVRCALLRIQRPYDHWIVATNLKEGILFLDSTAGQTLSIIKRDKLYAGRRRPNSDALLINPRELILFETR